MVEYEYKISTIDACRVVQRARASAGTWTYFEHCESPQKAVQRVAELNNGWTVKEPPHLSTLTVNEYQVSGGGPQDRRNITLRRMQQLSGPDKWAIYDGGSVLDKDGDFVYEPLPSSRTDEWLAFHRFDSPQEALAFHHSKYGN